ncbi:PH domain-containing protein [Paraliomyxa miuraensis]|uniref:hypothetical protein n=1 Tax=Paraliomyxa miuraensis TaxID=376150 RepID=UPI00225BEF13|nr:hypothetical protein [Paraliomyxa miuraensis]MCX4242682.1 hypothetical protein [Paraliomyxa miuraensis]
MPTKLKAVIGIYLASMVLDGLWLLQDSSATKVWIRLVIGALVVVFLLRGSEGMRSIVRGFAALGILFGGITVLQAVSLGLGDTVGLIVLATGLFGVAMSAFTFWALGQEDVQAWMASRSLGE